MCLVILLLERSGPIGLGQTSKSQIYHSEKPGHISCEGSTRQNLSFSIKHFERASINISTFTHDAAFWYVGNSSYWNGWVLPWSIKSRQIVSHHPWEEGGVDCIPWAWTSVFAFQRCGLYSKAWDYTRCRRLWSSWIGVERETKQGGFSFTMSPM